MAGDEVQSIPADPWQVSASAFPGEAGERERLLFLLTYAVLAPSIVNAQPWRFDVSDEIIRLYRDPSRMLPVADPKGRELTISCGAALQNLRVAARGFGYDAETTILPNRDEPDLLAKINIRPGAEASGVDRQLRDAIPQRRTVRGRFEDRLLSDDLLQRLSEAARSEGAACAFVHDREQKQRVAQLVGEAERIHLEDRQFREELQNWLRRRLGEGQEAMIEIYARLAVPSGHTPEGRDDAELSMTRAAATARQFASTDSAAASQHARAESAPILALVTTAKDEAADWLASGQAMQRMLLIATLGGVSASYLNPPIEIAQMRPQIAEAFGAEGAPQVLLRMGYAAAIRPTPRRPLSDVLVAVA